MTYDLRLREEPFEFSCELDNCNVGLFEPELELEPEFDELETEFADFEEEEEISRGPRGAGPVSRGRPQLRHPRSPRTIIRPWRVSGGLIHEPSTCTCPELTCPQHGSEYIRWVQSTLNRILGMRLPLNGVLTPATRSAVRSFQQREKLPVTGIVGPDTERALIAASSGQSPGAGATKLDEPGMTGPPEPAATPPERGMTEPAEPAPTSSDAEFDFEWETTDGEFEDAERLNESSRNWLELKSQQTRPPLYKTSPGKIIALSTQCATPALKSIPILEPKIVSCLAVEVPSERVQWLLNHSLNERVPNWVKQLNVDITKKIPNVKVTIELFRFIPVRPDDLSVVGELRRYMAAKGIHYYSSLLAELNLRQRIQKELRVSLEGLYKQAGVLKTLPLDEYRRYVVFVYATFPDSVKQYLRPVGKYTLNKFEFDKAGLRDFHAPIIRTIARDVVDSRWTNKKVIGIHLRGHTDDRGTVDYNYELGSRRATTVKERLKAEIAKVAPSAMLLSLNKIKVNVGSLGKDEPVSKADRALNRRVEVIFDFTQQAQSQPLAVDQVTLRCIKILQNQRTLDKAAAQRLLCVMGKMRNPGVDDRYFTKETVAAVARTNKQPDPTEWTRMRYLLSNPIFYGFKVNDGRVLKNLELLDTQVIEGIVKLRQLITYYSGAPALGALTTGKGFRAFDAWFQKQLSDENSIYRCYKSF
jgi:hypothetical protein